MKIFVSYSRKDGKTFAEHIHEYFTALGEDVFTDTKNIRAGYNWNKELNDSILSSDIFVIICTPHSLRSPEVEKEVEIAKNADKRIIPCVYTEVVDISDLKWNLNDYQGVKFVDEQQLGLRLYKIIRRETYDRVKEEEELTGSLGQESGDTRKRNSSSNQSLTDSKAIKQLFKNTWFTKIQPRFIAVDPKGYVYVTLDGTKTVKIRFRKFLRKGEEDETKYYNHVCKYDRNGNFIAKWGSLGIDEEFNKPQGIAVNSSTGNVYIVDYLNYRIQKFDSEGNFKAKWGRLGNKVGEFELPVGITVDSSTGYVYVADTWNNRIQKFDSEGNFIAKWGTKGSRDGEFNTPVGITVDSKGIVYVADGGNHRIQKFDSEGYFKAKWGSKGTADGQFNYPKGIAVDSSTEYVYLVDSGNYRIQKFDSNGKFLTKWGSEGTRYGEFDSPRGIAIDSSGYVYVADTDNHRIQVFAPTND